MVEQKLKVFENKALRRIFGLKRDEIIGRRKLHNEEPHNLYSAPNTIIKPRRMTWTGNVAHIGRRGMHTAF
jgi:PAS domain-containing protein